MKKRNRKAYFSACDEDAVSPVVGVMLMLVVTIIIAAVVSGFAGGIVSTSQAAPSVSLDVSVSAGSSGASKYVVIENLGGDSLNTKDLRIISSFTCPDAVMKTSVSNAGKVVKHTIDGTLDPVEANDLVTDTAIVPDYPWTPQTTNNDDIVSTRTADRTFGTAVLSPGSSVQFDRSYFLGFPTDGNNYISEYGLAGNENAHVTIIHIPSGETIYDKDVVIAW
ncbi:FlaG/FlaF family flagellin (archaellin) [Methanomicrobium sp. W14]|uniref:type IV pilin N-terminal domain-containing protein n=1 Tax=Methanomicrobium sp. W14 TaxID=2817839 RepID=UPI001AE1AE5C|nr:type IV pilin N-terminal domain-containing protein [Methanomicrobium sp. W14]MBP2133137.1 FlaG/FlaF family flagellin (archaellin) [Methanomicrobium sp. W14]